MDTSTRWVSVRYGTYRAHIQDQDSEITAYSDVVEESGWKLFFEYGGSYATTDNEKIIKDPNIQAAYIYTQNASHATLSIAAAKANKHILIEKMLALSMEECLEIEKAAKKSPFWLIELQRCDPLIIFR